LTVGCGVAPSCHMIPVRASCDQVATSPEALCLPALLRLFAEALQRGQGHVPMEVHVAAYRVVMHVVQGQLEARAVALGKQGEREKYLVFRHIGKHTPRQAAPVRVPEGAPGLEHVDRPGVLEADLPVQHATEHDWAAHLPSRLHGQLCWRHPRFDAARIGQCMPDHRGRCLDMDDFRCDC
jgi:hypothetical protein